MTAPVNVHDDASVLVCWGAKVKAAPEGAGNTNEGLSHPMRPERTTPMVDQIPDPAPKLRARSVTRCECPADHREVIISRRTPSEDGCWLWLGVINRDGYGTLTHDGRTWLAHRLAYFAFKGEIPAGLVMDHLCRTRACVNPDHLEPVSDRVNILRGEGFAARAYRREKCVRGHTLPERDEAGHRSCGECYANAYQITKERNRTTDVPPEWHGTYNGYTNYQCRCELCKDAGARLNKEQKRLRVTRGLADNDPRHGTYNGYSNWRCRCEPCRRAASAYHGTRRKAS